MYCPRCNLHSREYVDRCPLCEGPMEVDEAGSAVMKTPVMPDKDEGTDDFFQEVSFSLPEDKARKDLSLASTIALEIDQDLLDARKEGDTVRLGQPEDEPRLPEREPPEPETTQPLYVTEPLEDMPETTQPLYVGEPQEEEGQEETEEPSRSRSPFLLAAVLVLVCILAGLGYWFFMRPQEPAETHVAMIMEKPAPVTVAPAAPPAPTPAPAVSEQPATTAPTPPEAKAPEALPPAPEKAPAPAAPAPEETKAPAPPMEKSPVPPVATNAPTAAPAFPPAAPETKEVKVAAARPAAPAEPSTKKPAPEPAKPAATPKEPPAPSVQLPAPSEQGRYSVHVGSFKIEANAFALRDKLQKKGYPVICALVSVPGKGDWYRVRVGYYAAGEEVKQVAARLQKEERLSTTIFGKR